MRRGRGCTLARAGTRCCWPQQRAPACSPAARSSTPPPPSVAPSRRAIVVVSGTILALSIAFSVVNAIDKIPVGEQTWAAQRRMRGRAQSPTAHPLVLP